MFCGSGGPARSWSPTCGHWGPSVPTVFGGFFRVGELAERTSCVVYHEVRFWWTMKKVPCVFGACDIFFLAQYRAQIYKRWNLTIGSIRTSWQITFHLNFVRFFLGWGDFLFFWVGFAKRFPKTMYLGPPLTWMSQEVCKRLGSGVISPQYIPSISRWNNFLTSDPNFRRLGHPSSTSPP